MLNSQVNFDGLVGPTHFYGGLAFGNVASMSHKATRSSPKQAALQGLEKMRFMMELGIPQALFPPHPRPFVPLLRQLGYSGSDSDVVEKADPQLLALFSSSASMWTANSATVTPSCDSRDGKLHFTPANMAKEIHRSIEAKQTQTILRTIFPFATVHDPLPHFLGDEGAANHIRLIHSGNGIHLFVYGRSLFDSDHGRFPARQDKEALLAIIRRHGISKSLLLKQTRKAIDAGVFHNDVIAMGHEDLLIYHEDAFEEEPSLPLHLVKVTSKQLSLKHAVESYLFNSQIARSPSGKRLLIAPKECEKLDLSFLPFDQIHFVDLKQSMQNGGGPACLRLRVWLSQEEQKQTAPGVFLTQNLYQKLRNWIDRHYRDSLMLSDLKDPQLLKEGQTALDELTGLLNLGSLYYFQH